MTLKDFNNMTLEERQKFLKERGVPINYQMKKKTNNIDWYSLTYVMRYYAGKSNIIIHRTEV